MVAFSSMYGERLSRELGNADSTVLFTTARRKSAINEGMLEFADLTECYQRTVSWDMVGGVWEYDLSTLIPTQQSPGGVIDFVRPAARGLRVTYTDASSRQTLLEGDDLVRRDVEWLNKYRPAWQLSTVASSVMQLPDVWYIRPEGGNLVLGLNPQPSTGSSASLTAGLTYIATPEVLSSDTSEPFFTGSDPRPRYDLRPYHQAFVHYAASQLERFRRDDQASAMQMQKFLAYVARYLGQSRVKGGKVVTYVKNYFTIRGSDRGVDPRT